MADKTGTKFTSEASHDDSGSFKRLASVARDWIKADGSTPFPPAANRYHLYVSHACPWCSRAIALLDMKGLRDIVSVDVVSPLMKDTKPEDPDDKHTGWVFDPSDGEGCTVDSILGTKTIRELYEATGVDTTRFTVPILLDTHTKRIVSNESSEIIQMFNSEFNEFSTNPSLDLNPPSLVPAQASVDEWIYTDINNGVYKCGFAATQAAYEKAAAALFSSLDRLDDLLGTKRYLTGDTITLSDIRLSVTLVRFDMVYYVHFKCAKKQLREYPNLHRYTCDMYQNGLATCVFPEHFRQHYFRSHESVNPKRIVPVGPLVDFTQAHRRDTQVYKEPP